MSDPRFTVVVPAYNAEATLEVALASLEHQQERDFEVVVVDDGSTDGTGALADRLCDRPGFRVIHQANGGLPNARNAALRVARGRYVALLDSDDWVLPPFLRRLGELLESGPRVGLAFGDAWAWYEGNRRFGRGSAMARHRPTEIPADGEAFLRILMRQNFVYGAAGMPRALLEQLGGFNESLRAAEDWNLWMRIAASGHTIAQTGERLAVYRRRAGQMTADPRRMYQGALDALLDVRERSTVGPETAAALDAQIERIRVEMRTAGDPESRRRAALRSVVRPALWLRDHRLTEPAEVTGRFPELARRAR